MAVGGLISSRYFGSFTGSGKVSKKKQAVVHHRGQNLVFVGPQRNILNKRLPNPKEHFYMLRNLCCPGLHLIGISHETTMKQRAAILGGVENSLSYFLRYSENLQPTSLKRSVRATCECFLSSNSSHSSWIRSRSADKIGISAGQCQHRKYLKKTRTRADYKSEPYEITGPSLDSIISPEVPNEVVLLEEDSQKISPWWEQFPKRWVIVLLCFAAFLLCNMDRVNMSIAILPMSKEFNWNPATVGLIQSSFFWGYLLTQYCKCMETKLGKVLKSKINFLCPDSCYCVGHKTDAKYFC